MTKFCTSVDIQDMIKCSTFGDDRLRGLGVARGRISRFPIDLRRRPYNTLALPCECVMNSKYCETSTMEGNEDVLNLCIQWYLHLQENLQKCQCQQQWRKKQKCRWQRRKKETCLSRLNFHRLFTRTSPPNTKVWCWLLGRVLVFTARPVWRNPFAGTTGHSPVDSPHWSTTAWGWTMNSALQTEWLLAAAGRETALWCLSIFSRMIPDLWLARAELTRNIGHLLYSVSTRMSFLWNRYV